MNIKAIKAQQSIRKLDFNSFIDYQLSCQSQVVNEKNSKIQTQSTFQQRSSQDLNGSKKQLKNNHISELLSRKALLTVDYQNLDKVTFQPFLLGPSQQENLHKFQFKETKEIAGQRPSIIPIRLFSTLAVRRGSSAAKIRQDNRSPQTKKASDFKQKQTYPNIFPSRQSGKIALLKQSRNPEKQSFQLQSSLVFRNQQGELKKQIIKDIINESANRKNVRPSSSFCKKRAFSARTPEISDLQQIIEIVKIRIK